VARRQAGRHRQGDARTGLRRPCTRKMKVQPKDYLNQNIEVMTAISAQASSMPRSSWDPPLRVWSRKVWPGVLPPEHR